MRPLAPFVGFSAQQVKERDRVAPVHDMWVGVTERSTTPLCAKGQIESLRPRHLHARERRAALPHLHQVAMSQRHLGERLHPHRAGGLPSGSAPAPTRSTGSSASRPGPTTTSPSRSARELQARVNAMFPRPRVGSHARLDQRPRPRLNIRWHPTPGATRAQRTHHRPRPDHPGHREPHGTRRRRGGRAVAQRVRPAGNDGSQAAPGPGRDVLLRTLWADDDTSSRCMWRSSPPPWPRSP